MKRSYPKHDMSVALTTWELRKQTAVHEAGHAAAIYLGNREKQLPPIFFQIAINDFDGKTPIHNCNYASNRLFAEIKGGRLIHTLPSTIQEALNHISEDAIPEYSTAFEADIINLLVGPLAEAKYVAVRDGEPINSRLVNLDSLHYYGGSLDLEIAQEYLDCMLDDPLQRKRKTNELFLAAYEFINDESNWNAINVLADYIVTSGKQLIDCEEVMTIINANLIEPMQSKCSATH